MGRDNRRRPAARRALAKPTTKTGPQILKWAADRPNDTVMSRRISRQRRSVPSGCFDTLMAAPRRSRTAIAAVITATLLLLLSTAPAQAADSGGSANARFVAAGYQQLLGRSADDGGLDFHVSRLAAGGDRTRNAFTYSMLFSVEGSRQEVRRAYLGLLGRSADGPGEDYWTNHLQGHGVLDLRVLLMSSDEYYRHSGNTDEAWLEALYLDVLGRGSDDSGRQYWLNIIDSGIARPLVVAGLYLSDEALGRRVDAYYQEALDRTPTTEERSAAIDTIRRQGERGLRAEIWASDEVFEQYLQAALA